MTKRKHYADSTNRAYKCRSPRFKETVERVIQFFYRTAESLQKALASLRTRYRTVRLDTRKLISGLYHGSIIVTL